MSEAEQKHAGPGDEPLYAISAEFASGEAVLAAAHALRPAELGRLDIFSPLPIPGAIEAVGRRHRSIPYWMGAGGAILGFAVMMGMCVYATAVDYAFDIGGRPLVSWPSFVVPSVSFAMLGGALVIFFNWTFLCRLPLLNHPSFNRPGFLRASQDRYFLMVEPVDTRAFDPAAVEKALRRLASRPLSIARVMR